MPIINGKYYMNPQYGRALERDRSSDEEARRLYGEPEHSWLDHFLGFADQTGTRQATQSAQQRPLSQTQTKAATDKAIGNIIYNETSGLRPTSDVGSGSQQDLHEGRIGAGTVAKTLDANGKKLGRPLTVTTQLTKREEKAVRSYHPATQAYEDSQAAAKKASRDKNGPTHFYLDHGQPPPSWTRGKAPKESYGPFRNVAGGGDTPKDAKVWIRVYD